MRRDEIQDTLIGDEDSSVDLRAFCSMGYMTGAHTKLTDTENQASIVAK